MIVADPPIEKDFPPPTRWSHALGIFVLATGVRLAYVLAVPPGLLLADANDYDALAVQLSEGKGFVNASGEPTAYRPPVYPLFLAALYVLLGHDLRAVQIVQAVLGAGICVLVYFIAARLFNRKVAGLAGTVCSFYPPLIVNTSEIMAEPLFTCLLLLGVWFLIAGVGYVYAVVAGLLLGTALLTKPMLVFFIPFLALWVFLARRHAPFLTGAVLFAAIGCAMAPWVIRNYVELHAFVPLANLGGITLFNAYVVPPRGLSFNSLDAVGDEYYQIQGETERSRYLIKRTLEYIRTHPAVVLPLTIKKFLLFIYPFDGYWYPLSLGSKYNIFWGLVFCFAVVGLCRCVGTDNPDMRMLLFLLLSFLIGSLVFYGSPRFRLPIDPLVICFAVSGWMHIWARHWIGASGIVITNIALFALFRYVQFRELFEHARAWP